MGPPRGVKTAVYTPVQIQLPVHSGRGVDVVKIGVSVVTQMHAGWLLLEDEAVVMVLIAQGLKAQALYDRGTMRWVPKGESSAGLTDCTY